MLVRARILNTGEELILEKVRALNGTLKYYSDTRSYTWEEVYVLEYVG